MIAAASAAEVLPATLDAIATQDYRGDIEVVVAAADRETATAVADRDAVLVENPTRATPTGLNLAIKASKGDVIVRVDAHSIIPTGYVSRVVETLEETSADNVGGRQVPEGITVTERAIAAAMSSRFGAGDATYRIGGRAGPTDTVYLGAFRREVLERMNGYDERYLRHQDYELNQRIREAGGTVWFQPDLEVVYRPRPSWDALASQYFQYGRWKRFFARAHPGSLRPRQWAPPLLVLVLLAAIVGSIVEPWLLVVPTAYVIALVIAGLGSLPREGMPALLMPVALAVMHISWGAGFLSPQTKER